jgi:ribonucleoside-diphosphate reductase alpha chain
MDYIFRWLEMRFLTGQQQLLFDGLRPKLAQSEEKDATAVLPTTDDRFQPALSGAKGPTTGKVHAADKLRELVDLGDAPTCSTCGSIMTRNGSCYRCMSCGSTSGCS